MGAYPTVTSQCCRYVLSPNLSNRAQGHIPIPLSLASAYRRHELTCGQDTACRGACGKEKCRRPNKTTAVEYVSFTSGHNQFPNLLQRGRWGTADSEFLIRQNPSPKSCERFCIMASWRWPKTSTCRTSSTSPASASQVTQIRRWRNTM